MILVTGATGILGRVVVLELLKIGKEVRACKRPTSNLDEVRSSLAFYTENPNEYFDKIEWVNLDFNDDESLLSALQGVSEVYHCAGKVSFHPKDKRNIYDTNINGTKNLLYACENSSVKKFLFVSSIAVLDGDNENAILDEESHYNSKNRHSTYAVSKHFSEMEVWRASAEGLQTIIVNPGVILGSGNWQQSSGNLYKELANSFTFSGSTAYVDVRDVAKISINLMERNIFGERFILISESKKYIEMSNFVRGKLGLKSAKLVPKLALNIGKILNFLFGWIFPILKMANKTNIESVTSHSKISNQKVIKTLEYEFIPVLESLNFHFKNYQKKK